MMSWNEERLQMAEQTASFATIGFMANVREIGEALTICPKGDVRLIAEKLMLAVETIESLEKDVTYYKEKCEEEKK